MKVIGIHTFEHYQSLPQQINFKNNYELNHRYAIYRKELLPEVLNSFDYTDYKKEEIKMSF
jgi:hypothetical protein